MKILVITNYYPPHFFGGYELACEVTVEFLSARGHTVHVLAGDYRGESTGREHRVPPPYRILEYIDYVHPSCYDKHLVEKHNYKVTMGLIRSLRPDLVYLWNMKGISIAPVIAVQQAGVKKLFEIGDFWPGIYLQPGFCAGLKRRLKSALPFTIGGRMDISPVIAVSQWVGDEMKQKYGSREVFVVPNGVEIPEEAATRTSESGTVRYLFCGRIDPTKGLHLAIKAFGGLVQQGRITDFVFNIYGTGGQEYCDYCEKLVDDGGLGDQITFCGQVTNMNDIYRQHDVLLMPTLMREPFGLVVIEAMANHVVVIASNHYGPAEIIDDGRDGLLFEPDDVEELAEKILAVHDNPGRREELAKAARSKVVDKYDVHKVKAQVESILLKQVQGG